MTRLAVLLLALALAGCAGGPTTKAYGDSSAAVKTGDIITETITSPDGTVTVIETCGGCAIEESVGGQGSGDLYKTIVSFVSVVASFASIIVQVLK